MELNEQTLEQILARQRVEKRDEAILKLEVGQSAQDDRIRCKVDREEFAELQSRVASLESQA